MTFLHEQLSLIKKVFALIWSLILKEHCSAIQAVACTCTNTIDGCLASGDINQHLSHSLYEAMGFYRLIFTRLCYVHLKFEQLLLSLVLNSSDQHKIMVSHFYFPP